MYWSLLFLSNKNGSKFPKRRKQKDACWQGSVFIVFAVWNQACPVVPCWERLAWNRMKAVPLKDSMKLCSSKRWEAEGVQMWGAKDYKCVMELGPWMYSFGSSFRHDVVITPLRGKYSQAFNSSWKNSSNQEDEREMTKRLIANGGSIWGKYC